MKVSLNGSWKYICDPDQSGERKNWHDPIFVKKNWDILQSCMLPCCWNAIKEADTFPYDRYEGRFWFYKEFDLQSKPDKDYFIQFNGVNYYCKLWINGAYLGSHSGGFVPFRLKIPVRILESKNIIAIEVENLRKKERIPSEFFDWFNWGGIYRDITLFIFPKVRIQWIHIVTTKISPNLAELRINYKLTQPTKLIWKITRDNHTYLEGETETTVKFGKFTINFPKPDLWSPASPILYKFHAQLTGGSEEKIESFGIRHIAVKMDGIYLNNELIKIRGVSLHEEFMPTGRTIKRENRFQDLKNIKQLGFNTIRTAHYSHDEALIEGADELGLLILEEIPVYWLCDYSNPETLKVAANQLRSLIFRDFNHPSVILWSVGNEVPVEQKACYNFINSLMQYAKKLDGSRIVTYVSNRMISDQLHVKSDLACINLYFGWYIGSERNLNFLLDCIRETDKTHPWLITEFGAGAKFGFHSQEYVKFSEEKQASILTHSIEIFNSKDYIAGWIIWIYRDFRSALRTNKYQQGYNRKGIVSEKNNPKLITKVIHKVMNKIPKKRCFRILPKYFFLLKPVELLIFGILFSFFEESFSKKLFKKFYTRTPLKTKRIEQI
ncbi:MAG: glycoside hydrolase family 2 protein [Candidatus Helarchaeota archaeon]